MGDTHTHTLPRTSLGVKATVECIQRRPPTATSGSKCYLQDLQRKLHMIGVCPAGLPPQAPDQRAPHHTSTASSRYPSRVFPARPPTQRILEDIPDRMSEDMADAYARRNVRCVPESMSEQMLDKVSDGMSKHMPKRMSEYMYIYIYVFTYSFISLLICIYAIYTCRCEVRNYVRLVLPGGDLSRKGIRLRHEQNSGFMGAAFLRMIGLRENDWPS